MEQIPDDELERLKKYIPDILEKTNQERFRRRLLISTRIIAIGLIFAITYFGWVNYQYLEFANDKSACYLCGYENGKRCTTVYFTPPELAQGRDNILRRLGEDNDKVDPAARDQFTERMLDQTNYSGLFVQDYNYSNSS